MTEHQPRIFLCHAGEDKARVQALYHQLKAAGYHPWLDKCDLLPGQDWWTEIEHIISDPFNLVVVCLSNNSTTKRGVVQREIARALDVLEEMPEETIYLIPTRLEACQVPRRLGHLQWVDLFEEDCPENETDNAWLACTIAWMNLDVLAVQEILDDPVAQFHLAELIAELDTLTGGSWEVDLQECGPEKAQHVGFLWNSDRVTLSDFADAAQLNGAFEGDSACASNLRPGRYARAETPAGTDFHILSVHFDSGVRDRDYQNRRAASEQIPFVRVGDVPLLDEDPDVLVVGDFNTIQRTIFSVGRRRRL